MLLVGSMWILPYRDINKKVKSYHSDDRKNKTLVSDTSKAHISLAHRVLMFVLLLTAPDVF